MWEKLAVILVMRSIDYIFKKLDEESEKKKKIGEVQEKFKEYINMK